MEIEAANSEEKAKQYQNKIVNLNKKASKLKAKMEGMVQKLGNKAKGEDDYVNANADFLKNCIRSQ